MAETVLL